MKTKWKIMREEEIASTNTRLLEMAREGAEHGSVLTAGRQTGGRGRMGRSFLSPEGGLYMSVLLRELPYEDCTVMTAAAAVAFRRALQKFSDEEVGIKWVNDLLINGRKAAGILAEGVISPVSGFEGMVIGVGVNLAGVPEEVADIACSLKNAPAPDAMALEMLQELDEILNMPLESVMAEYRRYSLAIGRIVTAVSASGECEMLAVDTDDRARLVCLNDSGERVALDSGEIRIRL